ncbi:MAG: site-2 protease family protein [Acidimicrobiales bacterium]|nr:site-2 protease family protein [Acidimicrobiales bacterium]
MPPSERADHRIRLALLLGAVVSFALLGGWSGLVVVLSFVAMLTLHELGHFVVARWSGMQVTEFFLGFGPRLWSVQRGECTYGVKAIPAGAYVRITGMTSLDEVDPAIEHRTYRAQSYPRRLAVALAGSATHFCMALLLLFVLYAMVGTPDPDRWLVGEVVPNTTAAAIDLLPGDRIMSVDGVVVDDFGAFGAVVRGLPTETVEVVVERAGVQMVKAGTIGERLSSDGTTDGFFGVGRERPLVTMGPASAAVEASVRFGDLTVMSVDGLTSFFTPDGLKRFFSAALPEGSLDSSEAISDSVGTIAAPTSTSRSSVDIETPSTDASEERLLSIYGAARLGNVMLADGWATYLWFLVLVNVFIGVFNLVPLLPLDGGHVAIATYERLRSFGGRRHSADASKLVPVTWAVVSLLVLVGAVALYRDIVDLPDLG